MRRPIVYIPALIVLIAVALLTALRIPAIQQLLLVRALTAQLEAGQTDFAVDGIKVIMCGTGGPLPLPGTAKACILVIVDGVGYLVDTGPESTEQLMRWQVPIEDIGAVLLTHLHSDHIGELGEFNMMSWARGRRDPLRVYGPPGTEQVVQGFSMAYRLDQQYRSAHHGSELMSPNRWPMLASPIEIPGAAAPHQSLSGELRSAQVLERGDLRITAFEVAHEPIIPAYGYRFDYRGRSVVISGDTRAYEAIAEAAKGADLLLFEALSKSLISTMQEIADSTGNARLSTIMGDVLDYHTSPLEAAGIANRAAVKMLGLYHLVPPVRNFLISDALERGMDETRDGDWRLTRDGDWFLLPAHSKNIELGNLDWD